MSRGKTIVYMNQKICGVNAAILHTIFFFLVVTPNIFHLSPSFFEVVLFWLFIFSVIFLPGIAWASAFRFSLTFKELVGVATAVGFVTVSLLYFIVIVFEFLEITLNI